MNSTEKGMDSWNIRSNRNDGHIVYKIGHEIQNRKKNVLQIDISEII
jgi:hypothetical protein